MSRRSERRVAWTVALAFAGFGLAWVLLTDIVLYYLVSDPMLIARLETAKGWIFVAVSAALMYFVALRSARRLTRAQATLSAVLDSIGDGLLLLGSDGTIARANAAARRMLECDELKGMDAEEFSRRFRVSFPSGVLVPPEEFVSQRVFREPGPLRYKAVLYPSHESELVISVTAAAVRRDDEEPVRLVVSVMHDVTAAEHLERLRDQFFAAAAHTLKTPVAIIKANAQAILDGDKAKLPEASRAIDRQCGRIDRLVQNLLILSRARSNSLKLYMQTLELAPMIERITCDMEDASVPGGLRNKIEATPWVRGDRERLALVLRNLIDRALRTTVTGRPIIVTLSQRDRDAMIEIAWHRRPATMESSASSASDFDDLAISRMVTDTVVRAHGGRYSEENRGTDCTSSISLAALESAAVPKAAGGGASA